MLEKIRGAVGGIIVKTIIGLIIVSFALFGLSDIFRSKLQSHIAKVGSYKITKQYLDYRVSNLKQRYTAYKDVDNKLLSRMVLSKVIKEKLIILEAKDLGYELDNEAIFEEITKSKNFNDKNNQFSKKIFKNFLLANNISEHEYFDYLRTNLLTKILNSSFAPDYIKISNLVNLTINHQNMIKDVYQIKIKIPKSTIYSSSPSESQLLDFYEKNNFRYKAPEIRDISYLEFSCSRFRAQVKITDQKIKEFHNKNKSKYQKLEQREILQISAKDQKEIKNIHKKLKQGQNFIKLAKELNISDKEMRLGYLTKKNLYKDFVKPVFKLKVNDISDPVKGPFGYYIFKVTKIKPALKVKYAQIKNKLRNDMVKKESCDLAVKNFNLAEEQIFQQKSLSEIAKNFSLNLKNIRVSKDNIEKRLKVKREFKVEIINNIFANNQKNKPQARSFTDNNGIIFVNNKITKSRQYALDEVRGKVIAKWQAEERKKRYKKKAENILKKIKLSSNKNLEINHLAQNKKFIMTRKFISSDSKNISFDSFNQIDNLKIGEVSEITFDEEKNSFYIYYLNNKKLRKISKIKKDLLEEQISSYYKSDLKSIFENSYIRFLYKKYKVEISQGEV
jgi:peptidyl-prolyl cis-trans isomerase D